MAAPLHPKITVRLFREEKAFGPGIAELLERVSQYRSLRAAAQSMQMAYSKAWTMTHACEKALGFPLLHASAGGRNGGGAALTPEAQALLQAYRAYTARLQEAADRLFQEEFSDFIREEPHEV